MASSKKSLSDKFALEAKKKSPGKQSKKDKKASKSLSRELQRPASTPSPKKKAQKSQSDSLVVGDSSSKSEDKISETPKKLLAEFQKLKDAAVGKKKAAETPGEVADSIQKQEAKATLDTVSAGQGDMTEPRSSFVTPGNVRSTYDIGNISCPSHTIEKLEPSLKDTWHKPTDSPSESPSIFIDVSASTPKPSQLVKSSAEIHLKPRDDTPSGAMGQAPLLSVSSLSSTAESSASIDSISSELDTIIAEEINIEECSSTSTPIRFTLHEEKPEKSRRSQRPPKFSLIRETTSEDHDTWSSSGLSPTNTSTSLKSIETRNRIDDFSDDSDCQKLRESSEFSDDMQELDHRSHFVPLNKQLQIVTSMDRLTDRYILYRGSYMSAHVLLNLLNELGKRDKMRGLPSILSLFRNEFNKFNNT